jgi:hypothetical protein
MKSFAQNRYWVVFGLVLVSAALAYGNALRAPLFFDDIPALSQNTPLQIDGEDFDAWRTAAFSFDAGALHRPISMLSFAANYAAFGDFTGHSLKIVNLAIHLLIAVFVYFLTLSLFRAPVFRQRTKGGLQLVALTAAAIWLLQPLHVSTVLYSVQRMAQLSTLFTVLGLWIFIRYRLRWAERGASIGEILAASLWLLLITMIATLSKENGALLPWLLAVIEFCLFRGKWCGVQSCFVLRLGWAALLFPVVLIALIFVFEPGLFTAGYQQRDFTMSERLLTQSRLLWHYLGWLVLPDIRAMGFQHDDIALSRGLFQPITTLFALLAWLLILVAAFVMRRRFPLFIFGLLFFLVAHVMESSVLALEMVYEHRNYLPSIGVCLFLAHLLTSSILWQGRVNVWLPVAGVLSVLLVLLIARSQIWSGQFSLAQANVFNHPTSSRAQYFYATALLARYTQGQETDMDAQESKALMVAIRHQFLTMHQESTEDVLALTMLLYVDSYYFPALDSTMQWLALLEDSLEDRVLQKTDTAAISLMLKCIGSGNCGVQVARAEALVNNLIARNPDNVQLLLSKYEFLVATGALREARMAPLEHASSIDPNHASVQVYRVLERGRAGDIAGMYQVVGEWLAHDPRRWSLPVIMPLFAPLDVETSLLWTSPPKRDAGT